MLFLSSPNSTCKILSREIGANNSGSKIAQQTQDITSKRSCNAIKPDAFGLGTKP
jgi:hypothetical protein